MNIKPFAVEEWMNEYEVGALYNIAETCVDSVSLDELFELTGENKEDFLKDFCAQRLTYGNIWGCEALRSGISKLYHTIKADEVVLTHGAAGANHHVFCSLISAGDRVVSIMPTYQQLYSIPEAIGADVAIMHLKQENDYLPDLNELKSLVTPETKMICINNPNNPTGALMSKELLGSIVEIARGVGAYILCDEVYRHLTQEDEWCESIVDLYEKGISVSSSSAISASCARTSPSSMTGSRKIRTFSTPSPKPVRPRSFTTISISPPTSFASACTTRPVRSSRRATASSSPTACASATPATSTRSETALPR